MSLWLDPAPLVLASRSAARRAMLTAAGIPIELTIADIDERAVEARAGPLSASEAAMLLAREKARAVAAQIPGRFVVGADQTLALGERRFSKPGGSRRCARPIDARSAGAPTNCIPRSRWRATAAWYSAMSTRRG